MVKHSGPVAALRISTPAALRCIGMSSLVVAGSGAVLVAPALIITASVICADETPIRVGPGPKTRKRYLLLACTNLLTYYFLGDRSLATFEAFVFPGLTGVVVHDRYQNYDKFRGIIHQLCAAHLLRDIKDAAQS